MAKASFPKSERLCSKKSIEALFAGQGRSLSAFPLRVVFSTAPEGAPTQVLVSVSKRRFKHAVDRNRTKRQIREAWRLNKDILFPSSLSTEQPMASKPMHIAFMWLADELLPSESVHRKMRNLLHRINEAVAL